MTSVSAIDQETAAAVRHALAVAATGQLSEACSIGERALAAGGDPTTLHAMLGMFLSQAGNFREAIAHLERAHEARPRDIRIANNLASALAQVGRHEDALGVVTVDLAEEDESLGLMKLRGYCAQCLQKFETAVSAYRSLLAAKPDDWESWNNLGNALRGLGDIDASVEALRQASRLMPQSPPVQLNLGTGLVAAGRFDEAEEHFRRMAERFPTDAKPLVELHVLLKLRAREDDALDAIEEAVRREPDNLQFWLALASHQLTLLNHAKAEAAYREVIRQDPRNALGNLGLAVVFEVTNRTEELSTLVRDAAARDVEAGALNFIRAFDCRRKKRFEEGLKALRDVPAEMESARRAHLQGQLEEGAGRYSAAFAAFEHMNEVQRTDESQPEERSVVYRSNIRQQLQLLDTEWASRWESRAVDERPSPVFLVGFPRSGTTLLDTFLMGHPLLRVLEEEPMLRRAQQYLSDFAELPTASAEKVASGRNAYFDSVAERITLDAGTTLVDKNPLAMNSLPLIKRLFPDAKIILALRHPCDVVLSCFATNFKLNDGMSSFVRLDTAAELYDLSFSYFERAQRIFQLPLHTIIYEKMIEEPGRELKALFDFLELEWDARVLDHQTTARARAHIKTASYAQVVEPIYQRSAGRWRNYCHELEPVIPTLRPWIEKFGYEI